MTSSDTLPRPDLDKKGLAEVLGKSHYWVRDAVTERKIPFYWAGNNRDPRFTPDDVEQIFAALRARGRVKPADVMLPGSATPERIARGFARLKQIDA